MRNAALEIWINFEIMHFIWINVHTHNFLLNLTSPSSYVAGYITYNKHFKWLDWLPDKTKMQILFDFLSSMWKETKLCSLCIVQTVVCLLFLYYQRVNLHFLFSALIWTDKSYVKIRLNFCVLFSFCKCIFWGGLEGRILHIFIMQWTVQSHSNVTP